MTATVTTSAVTSVRRYYDRVDSDDVEGLLDLFTDDAVYRRPGYEPLCGRAELDGFYRGDRVIEQGRHTIATITEQAPRVAVTGTFAGRLKDGRDVSLEFADFFRLGPDGRFVWRETFFFAPLV